MIPYITTRELIARYDVLLLDAYGVLVDDADVLPGAVELIRRLNDLRKPYYIVTNDASKLPATAAKRYQRFGLSVDADRIITSGSLLASYFASQGFNGVRCAVLGTEDSLEYVRLAGGRVVSPSDGFEVLVIADESGFPFLDTANAALTFICQAVDRDRPVHLVLTNPDLTYPSSDQRIGFAAGSVAAMFDTALRSRYPQRNELRFTRLGKPDATLFAEAVRRSGTRNVVMVGDSLETDIRGARAFGLDGAWLTTDARAAALTTIPEPLRPTYQMRSLS
jgi:glycerol-1-phosphatase